MKDRFVRRAPKALTRTVTAGVIFIVLTAGSIGGYWGAVQYGGNFHTVEEGALYRSAQLSADELQTAIRDHGIKAILNLRGAHPGEPWYDGEVAVSNDGRKESANREGVRKMSNVSKTQRLTSAYIHEIFHISNLVTAKVVMEAQ